MHGATVDSATVDSVTVDGAHDVAAVGERSRFPYLFSLVWFPRSGAAHTITTPYDGVSDWPQCDAGRRLHDRSPCSFARVLENA